MCLIVDTNRAAAVFGEEHLADFAPILDWLTSDKKDGKLVVGGQLAHELYKVEAAKRFILALNKAGRARIIPDVVVAQEAKRVGPLCVSNDAHVIALACISGARILCGGDKALHQDFTNNDLISDPKGHIYQTVKHAHLLRQYGHTSACRKNMKGKTV